MTNPLDNYIAEKTAAKEKRKADEIALWKKWKESDEHPTHLQPLLKLYEPVFAQKTRLWRAPMVPESAFKAELMSHAIKAFQTYDPTRGAALNTWVEQRLPKALRYNNRYQNLAYIPEGASGKIGDIRKAQDTLSEDLGRPPTTDELADHLGMTPKRVDTILKAVKRDIPMGRSAGAEAFDYGGGEGASRGFEEQQIAVAQNILPDIFPNKPEMHRLFGHVFGVNGYEKITSTSALAKKMGKSSPQISHMKTQMGRVLRSFMGLEDEEG